MHTHVPVGNATAEPPQQPPAEESYAEQNYAADVEAHFVHEGYATDTPFEGAAYGEESFAQEEACGEGGRETAVSEGYDVRLLDETGFGYDEYGVPPCESAYDTSVGGAADAAEWAYATAYYAAEAAEIATESAEIETAAAAAKYAADVSGAGVQPGVGLWSGISNWFMDGAKPIEVDGIDQLQ